MSHWCDGGGVTNDDRQSCIATGAQVVDDVGDTGGSGLSVAWGRRQPTAGTSSGVGWRVYCIEGKKREDVAVRVTFSTWVCQIGSDSMFKIKDTPTQSPSCTSVSFSFFKKSWAQQIYLIPALSAQFSFPTQGPTFIQHLLLLHPSCEPCD